MIYYKITELYGVYYLFSYVNTKFGGMPWNFVKKAENALELDQFAENNGWVKFKKEKVTKMTNSGSDMKISGECQPIYIQLTKREQFAMAAMQGLLASDYEDGSKKMNPDDTVMLAVDYADTLIAELERG